MAILVRCEATRGEAQVDKPMVGLAQVTSTLLEVPVLVEDWRIRYNTIRPTVPLAT
jgi:hypothetical protein